MVRHYYTLFILIVLSGAIKAQSNFPYEAYLEEKVRDPKIRAYIEKSIKGNSSQADLESIQDYLTKARLNKANSDDLIQEGAEPHIIMHPTNDSILALSFMQNSLSDADYPVYISLDAGMTWTKSSFSTEAALDSMFPGNTALGGGDPILAFDEDGTLFFSYIYLHGALPAIRADMFLVYSTDTGRSFIVPPLEDHLIYEGDLFMSDVLDRQWMDIDNSGGPYDGNLYLSAFYLGGALNTQGQIVLTKPADSSSFNLDSVATAVVAAPGYITQFGNVQVDQSGRVHVSCAYMDENTGGGSVYHAVSSDGGKNFSTPTQVGTGGLLAPPQSFTPSWLIHERENAAVSLAVDRDNVYIAWTDLDSNSAKAYFSYSHDGGATFSAQTEFGKELLGPASYQFMPNVAADSGHLSLSWYAVDKTLGITNYYVAESADSGVTFNTGAVLKVSDTSSTFSGASGTFYGDYNTSVKRGCNTYTVWSDGRSGAPEIYVAKTRLCDSAGAALSTTHEFSPVSEDFQVGHIWPNPLSSTLNITLKINQEQFIKSVILDLQGKVVRQFAPQKKQAGTTQLSFDLSELPLGSFILKLNSESGVYATRRFMKN